jgi:hypothetical protein
MRVGDFHVALDDFRVPDLVEIGRIVFALRMERIGEGLMVEVFDRNTIPAIVRIVDAVEGLMKIADKVNEVADGFGAP